MAKLDLEYASKGQQWFVIICTVALVVGLCVAFATAIHSTIYDIPLPPRQPIWPYD